MSKTRPVPELISLGETNLSIPGCRNIYRGKVRDVYFLDDKIVMIATDRISAFDHVLPRPIPYKGAVLNGIAAYSLDTVSDIVPHWLEAVPDPNVSIGKFCEPVKLEMVVRGYLAGHAWREYRDGKRMLCGASMPEGMREAEKFPLPIITPTTKADEGHDMDISPEEILRQGIVEERIYRKLEEYTLALFQRGSEVAQQRGLILVDTKYEFGLYNGEIVLMDEIHTPDSSRYYIADGYEERREKGEAQLQLSKEFVREWLMDNGFRGREGDRMPEMDDAFVYEISDKYLELYEKICGQKLDLSQFDIAPEERIQENIDRWFKAQ